MEFFTVNVLFLLFVFRAVAMRRHVSSLVSQSEMNIPLVHSISEKTDKMTDVSETTAVNSDEFVEFGAFGYNLSGTVIPDQKLDAILADVACKLPSIDFDMSDVSFADLHFAHLMKTLALVCGLSHYE